MKEIADLGKLSEERVMTWSIATKIFLAFTAMLLLFAGVLAFNVTQMRAIYEEVALINAGYVPLSTALNDIKNDLRSYNVMLGERSWDALRRTVEAVSQHYDFSEQIDIKLQRAQGHVSRLRQEPLGERDALFLKSLASELDETQALNAAFKQRSRHFAQVVIAEQRSEAEELQLELRGTARRLESRLRSSQQAVREEIDTAMLRAQRSERQALGGAAILSFIALALSAGIMWVVHVTIRPLRRLTEGAKRIAAGGDYQPVAPVRSRDEIGVLAREFNAMVETLADRDAAVRRQAEELIKSERLAAVGEIAAKVTHELRNPLSTIQLNAELLADELLEQGFDAHDESQTTLRSIVSEVERLTVLTEDYLRFARLPDPNPVKGDLNELLEDVVEFQRDELEWGGVEVVLELQERLPPVRLDEAQMRRAVLNLIRNAREAMEGRPLQRLTVSTKQVAVGGDALEEVTGSGSVEVVISDTGAGIPSEVRAQIFEPFYSTKVKGTGLGLPLTHQIIKEHGGRMRCVSASGEGTTFIIALPTV